MDIEGNPVEAAEDLLAAGQAEQAMRMLRMYLQTGHGGLAARLVLGRAQMACGMLDAAAEGVLETALLYPDVVEAAILAGEVLVRADRLSAAIGEFQRALRIDPDNGSARFLLGRAWLKAGEAQQALEAFAKCDPDTPRLAEMRQRAERIGRQSRSDASYVRYLFDDFSADYDRHMLSRLRYRAPSALRGLFNLIGGGQTAMAVLDLGCGTGLAGMAFKDLAAHLTGIDLSPRMIETARNRGIYDALFIGDIEHTPFDEGAFDLLLAADTLVYLGDLSTVLDEARRLLKPQGRFLFSVE